MAKGGFRSLVSAVSEQFTEIKETLSLFPYFDTWDENSVAELCRIATIQHYPPDSVILGSDNENSHMVYFVLDGICEMIHYLQILEEKKPFKNPKYKLYHSSVSESNGSDHNTVKYTSIMFNEKINWEPIPAKEEPEIPETSEEEKERTEDGGVEEEDLNEEEGIQGETEEQEEMEEMFENPATESEYQDPISERSELISELPDPISERSEVVSEFQDPTSERSEVPISEPSEPQESIPGSPDPISDHPESLRSAMEHEESIDDSEVKEAIPEKPKPKSEPKKTPEPLEPTPEPEVEVEEKKPTYGPDYHLLVLAECINRRKKATRRTTELLDVKKPENLKTFFVRTGFLTKGATFGLEQSEKDMFIISSTKVKCLRIPKRFLLQHDPYSTSIWDRIKLFQRLYYPKNDKVLEKVKQEWQWIKYKKEQTQRIISTQKIPNHTSIADVPVVFRLGKVPGV